MRMAESSYGQRGCAYGFQKSGIVWNGKAPCHFIVHNTLRESHVLGIMHANEIIVTEQISEVQEHFTRNKQQYFHLGNMPPKVTG